MDEIITLQLGQERRTSIEQGSGKKRWCPRITYAYCRWDEKEAQESSTMPTNEALLRFAELHEPAQEWLDDDTDLFANE